MCLPHVPELERANTDAAYRLPLPASRLQQLVPQASEAQRRGPPEEPRDGEQAGGRDRRRADDPRPQAFAAVGQAPWPRRRADERHMGRDGWRNAAARRARAPRERPGDRDRRWSDDPARPPRWPEGL